MLTTEKAQELRQASRSTINFCSVLKENLVIAQQVFVQSLNTLTEKDITVICRYSMKANIIAGDAIKSSIQTACPHIFINISDTEA